MKLTYRDAITTALATLVVAITLAVTQGWAWPMLGSPRAGIIAVGILGVAMCSIGTRSEDMATRSALVQHPGMMVGSAWLGRGSRYAYFESQQARMASCWAIA